MAKTEITPCGDGCITCAEDVKRYKELINKLSSKYTKNSKNPETLCSASFKDFEREFWTEVFKLKAELFDIAYRHKLSWTQG